MILTQSHNQYPPITIYYNYNAVYDNFLSNSDFSITISSKKNGVILVLY